MMNEYRACVDLIDEIKGVLAGQDHDHELIELFATFQLGLYNWFKKKRDVYANKS